ncbi:MULTISPECIES: DUF4870 domain-containing protein [unclassified Halorhodospira]|uniref:DUF4870 domain-containing protein n=1 Tax=unclassified Halorhodospira TaxID=2626748 RepID=UPI001EE94F27|nr:MULTISPECIES: hypothetical protein [unclassified Halorhodospira]MCG5540194.1 hypothetical protein [Halorhodospira sp. M39old]MCG5545105.1 hypothetical protein [Halorhodospira sp. M38]
MSEDMNDKSTKKTSETGSKSSTTKSTGSTTKAGTAKSEAAKSGTVETAAEQSGASKSTSSTASKASSSAATGSAASSASKSSESSEVFLGNSGLPRHFAAGLSYVGGPVTGAIFLLLDRADPFVRFHAAQSLAISAVIAVVWICVAILNAAFAGMPLVFWVGLIGLLFMAFNAFQSKDWEVPVLGEYSQKLSDKVSPDDDAK